MDIYPFLMDKLHLKKSTIWKSFDIIDISKAERKEQKNSYDQKILSHICCSSDRSFGSDSVLGVQMDNRGVAWIPCITSS